jgi:hypothetical protein
MQRPIDAVTTALVKVQRAQQATSALIEDVIGRVSADPTGESSLPHARVRLSELRSDVDQAVDELIDALARIGEQSAADSDRSAL